MLLGVCVLLVVQCVSFIVGCSLLAVRCVLLFLVASRVLMAVRYSCLLSDGRGLRLFVDCLLCVVCCLWFADLLLLVSCCLRSVGCFCLCVA